MADKTEDQNEYITRKEFTRWRNGAAVVYLIFVLSLAVVVTAQNKESSEGRNAIVDSGRVTAVDSCNRDFVQISDQRTDINRQLEQLARYEKDPVLAENVLGFKLTPALIKLSREQQEGRLKDLRLPDCRKVAALITDDPRLTKYPPPYPRYPGDEDAGNREKRSDAP